MEVLRQIMLIMRLITVLKMPTVPARQTLTNKLACK
jgi:hypothetical protein